MNRTHAQQGGFTLVEVVITSAVLVPLLFAALSTTGFLQRHVGTEAVVSEVDGRLARIGNHLFALTRPAVLSSVQTRNRRTDSWATPVGTTEYPAIRFSSDDPTEPPVEFEFVRDAGEQANGLDDDGDGFVDEGRIEIRRGADAPWTAIATQIETWSVRLDGRLLVYTVQYAKRGEGQRVLRGQRVIRVCMRNT